MKHGKGHALEHVNDALIGVGWDTPVSVFDAFGQYDYLASDNRGWVTTIKAGSAKKCAVDDLVYENERGGWRVVQMMDIDNEGNAVGTGYKDGEFRAFFFLRQACGE